MQPNPHPAFDLIEEARFARRMLAITDASLVKIIEAAEPKPAAAPIERARPARLEVPTVNPEGWTDDVIALVRSGRALGATAREIAGEVSAMFGLAVTPQVVLAAVMHFDLDRREISQHQDCAIGTMVHEAAGAPAAPVVAHEAAPAIDEAPAAALAQDEPEQTGRERESARLRELWEAGTAYRDIAVTMKREGFKPRTVNGWIGRAHRIGLTRPTQEASRAAAAESIAKPAAAPTLAAESSDDGPAKPWHAEARRLYAKGLGCYAISKEVGASDCAVRILLIPGYREKMRDQQRAARNGRAQPTRPAPSLPPVSAPKPQPRPREPKTKPQHKTERRAVSKATPAVLPWSIPEKQEALATDIPADGACIALQDLQPDHCRWPMGAGPDHQQTYCGCPKSRHGSSYCDAHARRAFAEWPPRAPIKRPTRMARALSALPDAPARQPERIA